MRNEAKKPATAAGYAGGHYVHQQQQQRHKELTLSHKKHTTINQLHALGHDATPIFALYDPQGRLVLMSATPDDVVSRTALVRALTRILHTDPSP